MMKSKLNIFFIIGSIIFLILTVITFFMYMKVAIYNDSAIFVNMEFAGSEYIACKIDVSFITGKIATKGNTSFYFAGNDEYLFVVATDKELPNELEEIKKYSYQVTDVKPKSYEVKGVSYLIDEDLQKIVIDSYNNLYPDKTINEDTIYDYIGGYYLNIEDVYDKTETLKLILFISSAIMTCVFCFLMVKTYLKNR